MKSAITSVLWQAWLPVTLIVIWWVVSANSTSPFWPPLSKIADSMVAWFASGQAVQDLAFSFGNYTVALLIAIALGLAFGVAIGLMPRVAKVLEPYLDVLRSLPVVVFVPIIVLVLGVGALPKIFLIAFACVWPVLLHTIEGVVSMSPSVLEMSYSYRIPLHLRIRKVILPGSLPQIVVGIRIAITVGLIMLIVSEMYGSTKGVGYFINDSTHRFKIADSWAGTILIGVIGWLITMVYAQLENKLLAWRQQTNDQ